MAFSNSQFRLPSILIGTLGMVAIVQTQIALSLSSLEVNKIAKEITVRIDGQGKGSGVIVLRKGNTYGVITNFHVVENPGQYTIKTVDGEFHSVDSSQIKRLLGADLALVFFESKRNYFVAELGDSDRLQEGQQIYIAGYPGEQTVANERTYRFYPENLIGFLSQSSVKDGYELIYKGTSLPGMSGGPLFDENGKLIAIYGKGEINENTLGSSLYGIPVNTAKKLAIRNGINLDGANANLSNSSSQPSSSSTPNSNKTPLNNKQPENVQDFKNNSTSSVTATSDGNKTPLNNKQPENVQDSKNNSTPSVSARSTFSSSIDYLLKIKELRTHRRSF